ncbi:hypothetical protein [Nocardioides aquiterrae]|uniref:Uncharacterized protein n=1 Tax=Nocardioides aquiterrae TaxID=203799 RepID=A0ABN1UPH4_9ACTN
MVRVPLLVLVILLAAGCAGHSGTPEPAPTSVAAFPDLPRMRGPLPVRLQPALPLAGSDPCAPAPGRYCLGDQGYRALGAEQQGIVGAASTAPDAEHTGWDVVVRFEPGPAVRRAAADAAGMGGVVLIVDPADRVLAAVPPLDLGAAKAHFLGLEKAEAWALVDGFSRSKQGM